MEINVYTEFTSNNRYYNLHQMIDIIVYIIQYENIFNVNFWDGIYNIDMISSDIGINIRITGIYLNQLINSTIRDSYQKI